MKGYMLKDVDTGKKDDKGNPVMSTALWDANAIEKVTDDRSLAQRLGHVGYQRTQELFSIERNVRELCALIL